MIGECTECGEPGTEFEWDDAGKLIRVDFRSDEPCDECEAFKRGHDFKDDQWETRWQAAVLHEAAQAMMIDDLRAVIVRLISSAAGGPQWVAAVNADEAVLQGKVNR